MPTLDGPPRISNIGLDTQTSKPLAIDLYCGLGGWAEGFLAEGYDVVGFDNEKSPYPAQLVLQDVLTLHGAQFRDAAVIVASPPCQNYSYLAMPWSRSKDPNNSKAAKALRHKWETEGPDNRLFDACFRIQREAIEATRRSCVCWSGKPYCNICDGKGSFTRYIPLIVENMHGAQPWVGRSAWNYGSFHLWGDVPALMPNRLTPRECGVEAKSSKSAGGWFNDYKTEKCVGISRTGSKSPARKAASAQIAKIPFELSRHIAATYYPRKSDANS